MSKFNLDNLDVISEEDLKSQNHEYGMAILETVQKQLDLGLIDAAKSNLETAIRYLSK